MTTFNQWAMVAMGLLATQMALATTNEATWQFGIATGGVINKNETFTIHQNSNPSISITNAKLKTKPFKAPPYYALRVSRWQNQQAWEIEHIHQKLYLDELPKNVQHFEITDGYNLFFVNRAYQIPKFNVTVRGGMGAVIAHPQVTVYEKTNYKQGGGAIPKIWDTKSGYQWAGLATQVAVEKNFAIHDKVDIGIEGKITHANAKIDLADGYVRLPNTAGHLLVWLKYKH